MDRVHRDARIAVMNRRERIIVQSVSVLGLDQRTHGDFLLSHHNMRKLVVVQVKEVGMSSPKPIPVLDSGRVVTVRQTGDSEIVEVLDAEGEVEVSITLGAEGPVVRLTGAQLELEGTESVSIKTRTFAVEASETARMHAEGHLTLTSGLDTRVVADGEVHMLGTMIWLN